MTTRLLPVETAGRQPMLGARLPQHGPVSRWRPERFFCGAAPGLGSPHARFAHADSEPISALGTRHGGFAGLRRLIRARARARPGGSDRGGCSLAPDMERPVKFETRW